MSSRTGGRVVKTDLSEIRGETYGHITIEDEDGKRLRLRYEHGSSLPIPQLGSLISVEYEGDTLPRLIGLTILESDSSRSAPLPPSVSSEEWKLGSNPISYMLMILMVIYGYWTFMIGFRLHGILGNLSAMAGPFSMLGGVTFVLKEPARGKQAGALIAVLGVCVGTVLWYNVYLLANYGWNFPEASSALLLSLLCLVTAIAQMCKTLGEP